MNDASQQSGPPPAPYIHINRGVNVRYVVLVRARGHRKYRNLGVLFRSRRRAYKEAADQLARHPHLNRAVVLHTAEYYDPIPVLELRKP